MKIMPNRMDRGFEMYQQEFEDKALQVLQIRLVCTWK